MDTQTTNTDSASMTTPVSTTPPTASVATVATPVYAGFWWRVLAIIIDAIIVSVALGIIESILFPHSGGYGMRMMHGGYDGYGNGDGGSGMGLINLAGNWLYFALLESSVWQGTIGKHLLGLKVTDMAGNRISFGRATGRYFSKIISAIILFIGFIMVAFTEKKQGLHDLIAKTLVWKVK